MLNLPHTHHVETNRNLTQENKELETLDEVVSLHIRQILDKTGGKIHGPGGAADLLGINASTLRNRMNKLGIDYGRKSGPGHD